MLKIRYEKVGGLLSGWEDNPALFDRLRPRDDYDDTFFLDIAKPDVKDYEYFLFQDWRLVNNSHKQSFQRPPTRNLTAEIDDLEARVKALENK